MRFIYTNGENPDFIELCHDLDDFLNELVGGDCLSDVHTKLTIPSSLAPRQNDVIRH